MALSIQEVSTVISEAPEPMASPNATPRQPSVDMDRVRRELRRDISRLERLWVD